MLNIPATEYETKQALARWTQLNAKHVAEGKKGQYGFKPFLDGARNRMADNADYN